jgi:excisionase family DNA binding protein
MPKRKTIVPSRLLTTVQAEAYASLHRRSLHRMAADGRLTKYFVGSRLRWDAAELDALVSRKRTRSLTGDAA